MKKGFTLVEIIISLSLVLIVGVSTTFFLLNKKNNNELENITKKILEAANLYANMEIDETGNTYINGVKTGKKGVQIPLINLVNKGYIEEEQVEKIKELTNEENHYIMLLEGNEEGYDYCGDGKIFSLASWDYNGNDIYLCDNTSDDSGSTCTLFKYRANLKRLIDVVMFDYFSDPYYYILDDSDKCEYSIQLERLPSTYRSWNTLEYNYNLFKEYTTEYSHTYIAPDGTDSNIDNEVYVRISFVNTNDNGLITLLDDKIKISYFDELDYVSRVGETIDIKYPVMHYYRGNVTNNYLRIGEYIFRIVKFFYDQHDYYMTAILADSKRLTAYDSVDNFIREQFGEKYKHEALTYEDYILAGGLPYYYPYFLSNPKKDYNIHFYNSYLFEGGDILLSNGDVVMGGNMKVIGNELVMNDFLKNGPTIAYGGLISKEKINSTKNVSDINSFYKYFSDSYFLKNSRPVITIKSPIYVGGNGTKINPYQIDLTN